MDEGAALAPQLEVRPELDPAAPDELVVALALGPGDFQWSHSSGLGPTGAAWTKWLSSITPTSRTTSTSRPVSSSTSRRAVSSTVSPGSIPPPGRIAR